MTSSLGRRLAPSAVAAVALACSMLAAGRASAFCRTTTVAVPPSYSPLHGCFTDGLPLYWKNQCVSYSINQSASSQVTLDQAQTIIQTAFGTWNDVICASSGTALGIQASPTTTVTCDEVAYNQNGPNQNVIVFRDTEWPYNDPNNTLGLTTVTFNADNGEIYDADMEINATGKNLSIGDPVPPEGFDLLSVVTHEAGHFFGMAHATDPHSTMYASYKPGSTNLRTLTDDDAEGVCSIYPTKDTRSVATSVDATGSVASDACDPTPRHGFGSTCDANPDPVQSSAGGCSASPSTPAATTPSEVAGGLAFAAATFVATRRRRRRRR